MFKEKNRIVIWGIGGKTKKWLKENKDLITSVELVNFIDSKCNNEKIVFYNIPVYNPSKLKSIKFNYLVIISSFYDEIKEIAIKQYNINKNIIITENELLQICFFNRNQDKWIDELNVSDSSRNKKKLIDSIVKNQIAKESFNEYADYYYIKETYCSQVKKKIYNQASEDSGIIWVCWLQGLNYAPDIIKACIKSIEKHKGCRTVKLITFDNYKKYVSIPADIEQFHNESIMTHTQFSDILRLELLIRYGGLWIDAAMFCTGDIPLYVYENELFAFRFRENETPRNITSGFLYSKKNCILLEETLDILYQIWRKEKKLVNYFQLHHIFHNICDLYRDVWDKVSWYSNLPLFVLRQHLNEEYNECKWEYLKNISFIHSLSYKIPKDSSVQFSFYDYILTKI